MLSEGDFFTISPIEYLGGGGGVGVTVNVASPPGGLGNCFDNCEHPETDRKRIIRIKIPNLRHIAVYFIDGFKKVLSDDLQACILSERIFLL
jgi:hypothetical protein